MSSDKEKALKDFLLDIQCLDSLTQWSKKFNLFDTLKITGDEIRHSNVLAWLMDPNGNHGLGDAVLRGLLQKLIPETRMEIQEVFHMLLMDLGSFKILREYHNMDIFAVSQEKKFGICIENKVFSGEHSDQLSKYHEFVQENYKDYTMLFVYLTPDGALPEQPKDQEQWQTLDYGQIVEVITNAVEGKLINPDVKMVIQHYIDTVRRHIVGDKDLETCCKEIYAKHKEALDLIFEYRSNKAKIAAEAIKKWCQEKAESNEIEFDKENMAGKVSEIGFTTPFMSSLLPDFKDAKSGWNDKNMYHYAIYNENEGKSFSIALVVSRKNIAPKQEEQLSKVCKAIKKAPRKDDWQWWTLESWKSFFIKDPLIDEGYEVDLFEKLNEALKEIQKFEESIKNKC